MRSYRMQAAAVMLRQGNDSVAAIAGRVGYNNSSKFASAFKDIMGMSPLEYRKQIVQTDYYLTVWSRNYP